MLANTDIFCPRCATENAATQSYCRQCGVALTGIQWVLDGSIPEAQKRLESAEKWITVGNTILTAFILIAVTITILGIAIGNPTLSIIAMINVFCGAVIAFPFSFLGNMRLGEAKRRLSEAVENQPSAIKDADRIPLRASQTSALPPSSNRNSVTEHTTLRLTKPDQATRER